MGVTHLWTLLEPAGEDMSFEQMRGMKVAVDASIWAHRFVAVNKYSPKSDSEGTQYASHVTHFTRNILKIMHYGIQPIFVFDGPAPMLKRRVMNKRAKEQSGPTFSSVAQKLLQKTLLESKRNKGKERSAFQESAAEKAASEDNKCASVGITSALSALPTPEISQAPIEFVRRQDYTGEDLSFNMSNFLTTSAEAIDMARYRGELAQNADPSQFSSKQMHRFIDAVTFEQEKRSFAEKREHAFRLENVPEDVDSALYRNALQGNISNAKKLKKDMLGMVKGKQNRFFYIGPVHHDHPQELTDTGSQRKDEKEDSDSDGAFPEGFESVHALSDESFDSDVGIVDDTEHNSLQIEEREEDDEIPEKSFHVYSSEDKLCKHENKPVGAENTENDEEREMSEPIVMKVTDEVASEAPESEKQYLSPFKLLSEKLLETQPKSETEDEQWDEVAISSSHTENKAANPIEPFPETQIREIETLENPLRPRDVLKKWPSPKREETVKAPTSSLAAASQETQTQPTTLPGNVHRAIHDLHKLCSLFGIPTLQSPGEAEAQCAYLNATGIADAVITDDSDAFLFGATRVIRHFFHKEKALPQLFDVQTIQHRIGLDRSDFLMLGFILGGDYTPGLKGIGLVKSLPLIAVFRDVNSKKQATETSKMHSNVYETVTQTAANIMRHVNTIASDRENQLVLSKSTPGKRVEKLRLLIQKNSGSSPQKDKTGNGESISMESALEALRFLMINMSFNFALPVEKCIAETFGATESSNKSTDFGFHYILSAYVTPNVHSNLTGFSWKMPEWLKLSRYLHDNCGNRFSDLAESLAKLQARFRNIQRTPSSTFRGVNVGAIEKLVGVNGGSTHRKMRSCIAAVKAIRTNRDEYVSLEQAESWYKDLVNASK